MALKLAVAGLRHGHIFSLTEAAKSLPEVEVVACCEEDKATREEYADGSKVKVTHDNYQKMLDEVDCDAVAIGDYYQRRGALAIEALKRGKHVVADKPICNSLEELETIKKLSKEKNLVVTAMLDLRDSPKMLTLKKLISDGTLGEIHQVYFGGQHPLCYGTRANWYFEEGKHGGTINDIGIHGIDLIMWLTGQKITEINSSRNWNAILPEVPHFKDAAQFMLTMENGCGVIADVSYFLPDSFGYSLPFYWRFTVWGTKGIAEVSVTEPVLKLYKAGDKEVTEVQYIEGNPNGYLKSFVEEINGKKDNLHISSADTLLACEITLITQKLADDAKPGLKVTC